MGQDVTARRRRAYEDSHVVIDVIDDDEPQVRGRTLEHAIPHDRPVLRRVVQAGLGLVAVGALVAWFFPGVL